MAGRPRQYSEFQQRRVLMLLEEGRSVREVEDITGIPKSTVQRMKDRKNEQTDF